MNSIYLVIHPTGEYEDYRETVLAAFATQDAANEYAKKVNENGIRNLVSENSYNAYLDTLEWLDEYEENNPALFENKISAKSNWDAYNEEIDRIDRLRDKLVVNHMQELGYNVTSEQLRMLEDYEWRIREPIYSCIVEKIPFYNK